MVMLKVMGYPDSMVVVLYRPVVRRGKNRGRSMPPKLSTPFGVQDMGVLGPLVGFSDVSLGGITFERFLWERGLVQSSNSHGSFNVFPASGEQLKVRNGLLEGKHVKDGVYSDGGKSGVNSSLVERSKVNRLSRLSLHMRKLESQLEVIQGGSKVKFGSSNVSLEGSELCLIYSHTPGSFDMREFFSGWHVSQTSSVMLRKLGLMSGVSSKSISSVKGDNTKGGDNVKNSGFFYMVIAPFTFGRLSLSQLDLVVSGLSKFGGVRGIMLGSQWISKEALLYWVNVVKSSVGVVDGRVALLSNAISSMNSPQMGLLLRRVLLQESLNEGSKGSDGLNLQELGGVSQGGVFQSNLVVKSDVDVKSVSPKLKLVRMDSKKLA